MSKHAPVSFALVRNTARYYVAQRRWRALARALWWTVARRHGSELCQECGGPYAIAWHAPDPLWRELVHAGGGGLLCPACFDAKAERGGYVLSWVPVVQGYRDVDGFVPSTNYWHDPTRDRLLVGEPDLDYVDGETDRPRVPQDTWSRVATAMGWPQATYYWGTDGFIEERA